MTKYYSYNELFSSTSSCILPEKLDKFLRDINFFHKIIKEHCLGSTINNKFSASYGKDRINNTKYTATNLNRLIINREDATNYQTLKNFAPSFIGDSRFARVLYAPPIYHSEEFDELEEYAIRLRGRFNTFVIIGIGGAILNPASIVEFGKYFKNKNIIDRNKKVENVADDQAKSTGQNSDAENITIHYCNYLDPFALQTLSNKIDLHNTAFVVISRSGKTSEIILLTDYWCNLLLDNGIKSYDQHFIFVSSFDRDSPISRIAGKMLNAKYFIYPHDAGGRFATFTIASILVGLIAGLDMRAFCAGGVDVFNETFNYNVDNSAHESIDISRRDVLKSVLSIFSHYKKGHNAHVTISYLQYLRHMLIWQSQVFSESLGKKGEGIFHFYGIGPQEQHSQLPVFLEGPDILLFTIIKFAKSSVVGNMSIDSLEKGEALIEKEYCGTNMNEDLHRALSICADSTINAIVNSGKDIRVIEVSTLSMSMLGALMMRSILETVLFGISIGLDPYTQSSIEDLRTDIFNKILSMRF